MPIYLETCQARIADLHVVTDLDDTHNSANVSVTVNLAANSDCAVQVKIADEDGKVVVDEKASINGSAATIEKTIERPKLWWPNGQGKQSLYTATAKLLSQDEDCLDTASSAFGIRRIELIQRPLDDAPGLTFMFRVNGRDMFMQGGDWIPAEMMLPSMTREKYFDWVRLAAYNNLNMIRVWGGGIYEPDDFFDACDQYGILVWHDYAFACGHFPVRDEYLQSVREEAVAQTKRLRNRASLALLCGNNEDFMLIDWLDPGKYDHHDVDGPFIGKDFDWREIYLKVLPSVVKEIAPEVQYWPSSPWKGDTANDLTVGDVHQWDGKQSKDTTRLR